MDKNTTTWDIGLIGKRWKKKEMTIDDSYQRQLVWSTSQKQLFINSLLIGLDIPKIYLQKKDDNYYVIDGQQRIDSIISFIDGGFSLSIHDECKIKINENVFNLIGKKFTDFTTDEDHFFNKISLDVVIIENASDDDIDLMFTRQQNGTPLKAAEKRKAWRTNSAVKLCSELVDHEIFKTKNERPIYLNYSNKNVAYRDTIDKLLHEFLNNSIQPISVQAINGTFKIYKDTDFSNDKRIKSLRSSLNFLEKSFKKLITSNDSSGFKRLSKVEIRRLVFLVGQLLEKYNLQKFEDVFAKEFVLIYRKREELLQKKEEIEISGGDIPADLSQQCAEWQEYKDFTRSDSVAGQRHIHNILFKYFLIQIPDLEQKDAEKRFFNEHEREAIFLRARGRCENPNCAISINYDDFEADHVVPHANGGKTNLSNAQALCRDCNRKKSDN